MQQAKGLNRVKGVLIQNNSYIIFLVLFVICSILSPQFLTVMNLRNIALQQSAPVIVAIGMLFVVLTGGIDLSVGSIMALGGSIAGIMIVNFNVHYVVAILVAMLAGMVLGLINGLFVAYAGMQGFVVTLAMMTIARGLAFIITNGTPIKMPQDTLATIVSKDYMFPIIIIACVIIALFVFIQRYSAYGRTVIAIGSNRSAVQLAGIRTKRYEASVYMISGLLAALAGVFVAARSSTGSATIGDGQELDAIAACVIGGASLAGGKGFVFRTVIGAMILALITNIMNLMSVPSYPQDVIKGVIIILAVLLQIFTSKSKSAA